MVLEKIIKIRNKKVKKFRKLQVINLKLEKIVDTLTEIKDSKKEVEIEMNHHQQKVKQTKALRLLRTRMLLEDSKEELTSTNLNLKEVIKKKMMLSP